MSGDAIHRTRHRLHSFFVQTYHLKDALKGESATIGVSAADIERAVTDEPDLTLLADLANLDKHGNLNRAPRSGHVPKIVSVSGITDATPGTWRLDLVIEHDLRRLDGLAFAKRAVEAWRKILTGWGLL